MNKRDDQLVEVENLSFDEKCKKRVVRSQDTAIRLVQEVIFEVFHHSESSETLNPEYRK